MSAPPTPVEIESGVSRRQLWLGILLPTGAWAVHGMVGVVVALLSCRQFGLAEGPPPGITRPLLFGLTLAALAVAVVAVLLSLRTQRRITGVSSPLRQQGHSREEFMALVAVFFSAIFLLGIVFNAVPVFLITDVCEGTR